MFQLSSTDWHQFLGFGAPPSTLGKRKRAPWEDEAEVSRMECRHQLATMDLEAAAQRMTGRPNMRFRGVQDPAMRAIQRGESPIPQGAATVLDTELGFSPERFSGWGMGVGTNETVWGTIVAPDGVGCISNFSRLLVG
jgi:hypothetical protein